MSSIPQLKLTLAAFCVLMATGCRSQLAVQERNLRHAGATDGTVDAADAGDEGLETDPAVDTTNDNDHDSDKTDKPADTEPKETLPPAAPTGLSATAITADGVELSWAALAATATGIRLDESVDGVTFTKLTTVGLTTTTYVRRGLAPGVTRHYRAVAYNAGGNSPASASVVASLPTKLVITAAATSAVGVAVAVTVQALDASDDLVTSFDGSVTLRGSGSVTGDGIVTLTSGTGSVVINDVVAESVQLSLSDTGATGLDISSTDTVAFTAGPPAALDLTGPTRTWAGFCSDAYTISAVDGQGNPATFAALTPLTLTVGGSGATFSDAACMVPAGTVNATAGAATATFYFKSQTATSSTLSAANADVTLVSAALPVVVANNITNTPANTQVSATTNHTVSFTTQIAIPNDGKILVVYPAGFNVAAAAFSSWSGLDGGQSVSVAGQVVIVTRDGTGTEAAAGPKTLVLSGITNTATPGLDYTVTLRTRTAANVTLEGSAVSAPFSIVANASLTAVNHTPWNPRVSATGRHTVKFTTGTALPVDAKIKLTFPIGFDVSGATFDTWTGLDGGQSLAVSGQDVTVTRDGAGTIAGAGAKTLVLNNVVNAATVSSAYASSIETTQNGGVNLEGPTPVRFSITNHTGLGDTPWPAAHQNYRGTRKSPNLLPAYPALAWRNASVTGLLGLIGVDSEIFAYKTAGIKQDLYALKADGSVKWTYATPTTDCGTLTCGFVRGSVDADGVLYVGERYQEPATTAALYAIGRQGNLLWRTLGEGDGYNGSLDMDHNGNFIVKGMPHTSATFFSADGLRRGYPAANLFWNWASRSIVGDDDHFYTTANASNLFHAFRPDGSVKWTFATAGEQFFSAPALDGDGMLYIATRGAPASLLAVDSVSGTQAWSTVIPNGRFFDAVAIGTDRIVLNTETALDVLIYDKSGNLIRAVGETDAGAVILDGEDSMIYPVTDAVTARTKAGDFKWKIHGAAAPLIGEDQTLYASGSTLPAALSYRAWTLSAAVKTPQVKVGGWIDFVARTSILGTDPATAEANQVQVYWPSGTKLALTYAGLDENGDSVWRGSYKIPAGTAGGVYAVKVEAAAVGIETDVPLHFATPPTDSQNTGRTVSITYSVD